MSVCFRDKTEPVEKLTAERRKAITVEENGIYGKPTYNSYTRKENALKIFTDDHGPSSPPAASTTMVTTASDDLD